MLRVSSLLLILLAVSPAFGQQSVAEAAAQSRAAAEARKALAAPPTREDVLKLFDLLQITKTMDAVVNATKQQSMEIAEQMMREKMPEATPEQKKKFQAMLDEVMHEALGPAAEILEHMWDDALWKLKLAAELEETRRGPKPRRRRKKRKL